jgi:hypothetical protein
MILEKRTIMAEIPPHDSPQDHNAEGETGRMCKCTIRLTDSALRYAVRHQLKDELTQLELGPESLVGDVVSLESGERPHDFIVQGRRWVIASEGKRLEFTLDHPARTARP